MDRLYQKVAQAIAEERIVFSIHADNQLTARNVEGWQVVEGFATGQWLRSEPDARPHAKVIMRQMLADGTAVVVVWALVKSLACVKLVTVYFPDQP